LCLCYQNIIIVLDIITFMLVSAFAFALQEKEAAKVHARADKYQQQKGTEARWRYLRHIN